MIDYRHYTYRVIWSGEDAGYIGLCAEFPSLSFFHTSQIKALEGITNLVCSVIDDMEENGEETPTPLSEKQFSGKFQVRITPEQHRMIAMRAHEEGISLNRYISYRLSV